MPKKWLWCSHSHGAMGILIFAYVSHHHESLDTYCPLDVSQEFFDDFRKVLGISDTWIEMKIKVGCLEDEIPTFSFVHPVGLPHSIHLPASASPTFPPCSGLQGLW